MLTAALRNTVRATRGFASSARANDVAKVTLLGRIGSDPVERQTANGKPYYMYTVATAPGSYTENAEGERIAPPTSWHTVFAFNEKTHPYISTLPKGATVYVEAQIDMKPGTPSEDGKPVGDRVLLTHRNISIVSKPRTEDSE